MFHLRPYQEYAICMAAAKISAGCRSLILVSPTGSGKTVIGSHIILKAIIKGNQTLFLAHRKELVDQCSKKLAALSLPHGIIMAGHSYDSLAPVQVASLQTANRRELPAGFRLIIIDECHHAAAESKESWLAPLQAGQQIGREIVICHGISGKGAVATSGVGISKGERVAVFLRPPPHVKRRRASVVHG